jgi:hypothetical protein
MRDILIIFAVLLVLLLIISALGGTVRMQEKFEGSTIAESVSNLLPLPSSINNALNTASPLKQNFVVVEEEENFVDGFDGGDVFASIQG